jgi:ribosomal protein S20
MPIIKSAIKRMKQTVKRHERNVAVKRDIKSAVKAFIEKPTADGLSQAQSELDTAVKKNLLNKNTAARRKSHLAKIAKEAGVKMTAAKKPTTAKPTASKKPAAAKETAAKPAAKKTTTAKKPATKKPVSKKPTAKKTEK